MFYLYKKVNKNRQAMGPGFMNAEYFVTYSLGAISRTPNTSYELWTSSKRVATLKQTRDYDNCEFENYERDKESKLVQELEKVFK